MSENTHDKCAYCLKEDRLNYYWNIGSRLVYLSIFILPLFFLTEIRGPENPLVFYAGWGLVSLFVFVALIVPFLVTLAIVVWGKQVLFVLVKDCATGKRSYHIHTPRSHRRWVSEHPVTDHDFTIIFVGYGGLLHDFCHHHREWKWTAMPGSSHNHILLQPDDQVRLDCYWRQALRIAERNLGYEKLYSDYKVAAKDRDELGVKLQGTIDWIGSTEHSIGRSKKGMEKRKELEAFMGPYEIKYEKRWAPAIEKELRDDPVETEPDLGPRGHFPDEPSGFIMED